MEFDPKPLAAASLGQVHRAVLRDGHQVGVKVQRPDIRETIVEDLEALEEIARFLDEHTEAGRRYGFCDMLDEFGRKITDLSPLTRTELDGSELARQLFEAYLKQIIVDGLVHADPHPCLAIPDSPSCAS